ncbi:MAG TPA: acyltransferase [Pirellulaceae bacterium]|nr:acyltransferase [Pirellulaceae bacterium]
MSMDHAAEGAAPAIRVEAPQRSGLFVACKRCLQTIFLLLVAPRLLTLAVARALLGRRAFMASSESIARIPGLRGVFARQAFYGRTLARCGQDVSFGWMSVFSMPEAEVGDRVYIGRFCSLGFALLEDEVMLADRVQILSGGREHSRSDAAVTMQSQDQVYQRVRIGTGAWIGTGAVVMADVGEHSIIGAGAVVNKPIPSYSVAVGVPARVVKTLPQPGETA